MVKNTKGGKNSKRMGRKFVNAPRSNKLRTADPNEPAEIYACVSKCLGNGMAHVTDTNSKQLLLHIRNKFRGRGKRDNTIKPGSVLLVGKRDFETHREGKLDNCDLLEVYNDSEIKRLIDETFVDFGAFKEIQNASLPHDEKNDMFEFGLEKDNTIDNEIEAEINNKNENKIIETICENDDDDLNIDDI
jgi:translation initiation factor IF-1